MAGRWRIWARNRGRAPTAAAHGPDIAVAPARRWALGLMIAASAGALLATSDPADPHSMYSFEKSSDGPRATLSASKPRARYLVRVRVTELGPEQVDTTESALATVHGTISTSTSTSTTADGGTAEGGSPFVHVSFGTSAQASDSLSALTSFQIARPLRFTGNCGQPEQDSSCQAEIELDLDLERTSALPADGSASVDWAVDFESRALKPQESGKDETLEPPWIVEITEIVEP